MINRLSILFLLMTLLNECSKNVQGLCGIFLYRSLKTMDEYESTQATVTYSTILYLIRIIGTGNFRLTLTKHAVHLAH